MVNGERQAIFLDAQPVYEDSYGTGGTGDELAKKILKDLKRHAGVEDERILFMAGKVTDGQYINEGFVERMNNALWEHLPPEVQDEFWWPLQWDPAHWLDKVFDKFMDSEFVSRLLMRTKLFHTLFSYGKMHSVAKATAEEHDLPFRTTISFAKQRFLSSSYQQFVRLENSFAAYVETYRDHDNKQTNEYKLAGQDFVFDLLGLIDLLRPIVLLMLRGQLLWCPGWKLVPWLNQTVKQLQFFSDEICQAKPSKLAAPNIHRHVEDICAMKFKDVDLVDGWLVEDDTSGKPTEWKMRELDDCRSDLKNLAVGMNEEIKRRRVDGLPKLLELLSDCLDFGELFRCLVGRRVNMDRFEIDKPLLVRYGRDQFRQCVEFVARLPYVKRLWIHVS